MIVKLQPAKLAVTLWRSGTRKAHIEVNGKLLCHKKIVNILWRSTYVVSSHRMCANCLKAAEKQGYHYNDLIINKENT